jgi:hypothetical protein
MSGSSASHRATTSSQSTSRQQEQQEPYTPTNTTAPQRRAPLHPHLQHQQQQAAATGAIVRGCLVIALLVLVSLAPAAAYFGWFRPSSATGVAKSGSRLESAHGAAAAQETPVREFVPGGPALSADEDHAIRSRLWLKYVGRAPIKHDEALELPKVPPSVQPPNLLQFRERFAKADAADNGEFIQHAQDARIWLEVADEPAAVFAWAIVEETTVRLDSVCRLLSLTLFCFFFFFFFFVLFRIRLVVVAF